MKQSQQSNWYRFHAGALGLLLISSAPLIAQQPAVTSGSVIDSYTFASTVGVAGVVVDTHGNILFSDTDTDDLDLLAPGSSTPTVLASGFTFGGNKNLRLDSAGNLYVISAYSNPPVLEVVPYQNGAYNFANAVDLLAAFHAAATPVDGGYMQPSDVAISASGLVYVGSFSNSATGSNPCAGADCIFSIQRDGTNPQIALGPLYNYMPAVSLALDQYGNLSFADTTGIYTINVSNLSTPPTTPISNDTSSGLSVDTAGNLLVSDGQTSTQTLRVIPLQNGAPNGAAEYIATGNFYSNASVGVYPVSNASLSGDGGYGNPGNIRTQWVGASDFGSQAVGVGNTAGLGLTFNFNTSGTFSNIVTVSEGTPSAAGVGEFNYGSGYTMCTAGTTYGSTPSNHTCTLYTNFDPAGVGTRSGSIFLTDSSGNVLANHHLTGVGLGALTAVDGGSSKTLIAGTTTIGTAKLSSPSAVAVDGLGNVYVADTANARIVELVSGATAPVVFTTGTVTLTDPKGVAVDGAGDIYIADGTGNKVVEVDITGHATTLLASTASIDSKTPAGLNGIAVDGLGNVFVSDTGNNRILRIGPYSVAGVTVAPTTTFAGTALKGPVGIAVDGNDNLYIADTGNNRIVEFNQFGAASVSAADGKTYSAPTGVAVDPAGDLYVADSSGVTVVYTNGHELSAIPTGLSAAYGVALDTLGDIFVANTGDDNIVELNTSSPSVNLGSEAVGSSTTAVSLLLYNIGNQALMFSAAPTLDSGDKAFTISSNTCTNGSTVATGGVCFIGVTFTPTTSGAATGSITLTDNAGGGTQTISLSGTGTSSGVSATVTKLTATPNPDAIGKPVTFKATVTSTGGTPTGSVSFYVGTGLLGTVALTNGSASLTEATTGLPAGTYTVTAQYTATTNYSASSGSVSVTLSSVVSTTTKLVATPDPDAIGTPITFKATVTATSGTPSGSVSFYVGTGLLGTVNLSAGSASLSVGTTGLPAGTYSVTANYNGTSTFSASTGSTSVTLDTAVSTTTVLTATPNPVKAGTNLTLKATVTHTGTGPAPTGTVSFKVGTGTLATVNVTAGVASYTVPTTGLPAGTYPITATYSGDASNETSNSNTVSVTITN